MDTYENLKAAAIMLSPHVGGKVRLVKSLGWWIKGATYKNGYDAPKGAALRMIPIGAVGTLCRNEHGFYIEFDHYSHPGRSSGLVCGVSSTQFGVDFKLVSE